MDRLHAGQADSKVGRQLRRVQINRDDGSIAIERVVQLAIAVLGPDGGRRSEEDNDGSVLDCPCQLRPPDGPWANPFVVPHVDAAVAQPAELGVDDLVIVMRVTDERVGLVAAVCGEWLLHSRLSPARSLLGSDRAANEKH